MGDSAPAYAQRCAEAAAAMRALAADGPPRLAKSTSNLFRDRAGAAHRRLDLSGFDHVIEVNSHEGWVDVEGGTSYEALVAATLAHGRMPAVVPQLKTITAGGAAAGVGIEATSFRAGLVHHTMRELDVLLPSGEVVACTPDNEYRDLFHGFPNSYGTLGYALRLRLGTVPTRRFVQVEHRRCADLARFIDEAAAACRDPRADFVDGVVFDRHTAVLNVGRFTDWAPGVSDYGYERIYYRSLLERELDHLRVQDYLWRWDTDWFWCSRQVGAQHPIVRRLLGRSRLNSRTYQRVMRWNSRWGLTRRWARLTGRHPESVIQDVDIPLDRAGEFLDFLLREIGIVPIWVCPLREVGGPFTLFPLRAGMLYLNFGFWDVVDSPIAHEPGHFNRLVEREAMRLGGIKSLYSDSFFSPEEFARAYDLQAYERLKARYDPQARLLGLYEKCVLRR
ncbi:FAD-binding oxidoreductase [Ideonella sp.]|uniref:FAD-binding oxidoreductase n=1 Tax=Ideonella sp. TaxID=1929293 RepID=UPI002B472976|nr:FAD-binding oxidoreductase [Ideonella sp.]HJV68441.1 FAD-binding oxidoreductase [Ideonella sp.]